MCLWKLLRRKKEVNEHPNRGSSFEEYFDSDFITWHKGDRFPLSEYFSSNEFECKSDPEGAVQQISTKLICKLTELREELGLPIGVTSGFRSKAHQEYLMRTLPEGHVAKKSQHLLGRAADITCQDMLVLNKLAPKYFDAIGIASTFLHVDLRDDKVRRWRYS